MVYVISKNGKPLMPCSNVIARLLLKQGKAKVKKREPFTIKLNYITETEYLQDLTLASDTGSKYSGYAVSNEKDEILYTSEVENRNDVTDKMSQRSMYRRNRRSRKTRYRKPRFDNRKNSIKKDRHSPTLISKFNSHIREIEFIESILPIKRIVFETGTFDPHLMKNSSLSNPKIRHWGYQKGPNYGFENTKARVLNRDNYTCQICKNKSKDSKLEVHHIQFSSENGSDDEENLITLCSKCHKNLHSGKIKLNLSGKTKGTLKHATQMNTIRSYLLKKYPEAIETFGYITKANRLNLGLEKDHYIDACVIATEGRKFGIKTNLYKKKCISDGDFQQTKGIRSEKRITTTKILGFRKFDKVKYLGKYYFIKARMSTGYGILMDINGKEIDFSYMPKGFKISKLKNMKRISARSSCIVDTIKI